MTMYFSATKSIDQLQDRLTILSLANERSKDICFMARQMSVIYFFSVLLGLPTTSAIGVYLGRISENAGNMTMHNTNLSNYVGRLEDSEKEYFFNNNIKLYYSDFDYIPNTDKYQLVDSFEACRSVIAMAEYLVKNTTLLSHVQNMPKTIFMEIC
jgi:hypothetical protein